MGGKYSRSKGMRGEYAVRDALRREGFEADRVPSSGAAEGFKGDVKFTKNGVSRLAEVKVRGGSCFKHVYALYQEKQKDGHVSIAYADPGRVWCIDIADSATKVLEGPGFYPPDSGKGAKQAVKLFELLGPSDILVIKNDRMPFLYIRYRK